MLAKQRGWQQCEKGRGPKNPTAQEVKDVVAPFTSTWFLRQLLDPEDPPVHAASTALTALSFTSRHTRQARHRHVFGLCSLEVWPTLSVVLVVLSCLLYVVLSAPCRHALDIVMPAIVSSLLATLEVVMQRQVPSFHTVQSLRSASKNELRSRL